jgi:NADPH:quinone reductase-like Zn-dependent oxidoreductase
MTNFFVDQRRFYPMKAAVVFRPGTIPVYTDFEDPICRVNEVLIDVTAAALTHFVKLRAEGNHYSFHVDPPFVAGIDGLGKVADGRRVYFLFPRAPYGGMAEQTVVDSSRCIDVPEDVDDITLAALADPGMAAWVALRSRAKMESGETVLINGATGIAGIVAVQIAKYLGARHIVATGRNPQVLSSLLSIGADEVVSLNTDGKGSIPEFRDHFERGVDIVLDYLWGPSAENILAASSARKSQTTLRFIQIGTTSAPSIRLEGTILRQSALQIIGSGIGSVALSEIITVMNDLMQAASKMKFNLPVRTLPLRDVAAAWTSEDTGQRVVLTTNSSS